MVARRSIRRWWLHSCYLYQHSLQQTCFRYCFGAGIPAVDLSHLVWSRRSRCQSNSISGTSCVCSRRVCWCRYPCLWSMIFSVVVSIFFPQSSAVFLSSASCEEWRVSNLVIRDLLTVLFLRVTRCIPQQFLHQAAEFSREGESTD